MTATDAQMLWLSAIVPNDQFLLYVFYGAPDIPAGIAQARRRAEGCDEFRLRVVDDNPLRYPRWVRGEVADDQFVTYDGPGWPEGLLDATRATWRMHVFPPDVVVLQMSHALGDGRRCSALAAALLGRPGPVPPAPQPDTGVFLLRALAAARAHQGLPPPAAPRPALGINVPRVALGINATPRATPQRRTLLTDRNRLGPTVTVGAMVAISEALAGYLRKRGEDVSRLGAEVSVAGPTARARNNFRNVGIGLYPECDPERRAERIAADIAAQRRRIAHPATVASDAAVAAAPAWLLRWGVSRFDPAAHPGTVSGNTVVSSVDRGPADLTFGGCPVRYTAGFPALSPRQSLTHGVHGIGRTVAVSVLADPANLDVDDYVDRLAHALGCRG